MTPTPVDQLARMLDLAEPLVAAVRDEQWVAPTQCTDWDVRALVNHLVAGNLLFAGILTGRTTVDDARRAVGGDQLGDQPVAAYRAAADAVVAAFARPGTLAGTFTVPFGTVPGAVALHLRTVEVLVHGWDLATATGQQPAFPDDVIEQELQFTRGALAMVPPGRSPFAPPQPAGDHASAIDRLAACLGRQVAAPAR